MIRSLLLLLLVCATSLDAQSITTGVTSDSIRVGDPVRVVVRIDGVPAGTDVILPDTLRPGADVENAGRVRISRDTIAGGQTRLTAAFPIIAWRAGETQLDSLSLVLRSSAGDRSVRVGMPRLSVISVLPADTANIQAKPPKDVWGGNRVWWPWVLAAVLLLALAALAYWWYRKRTRRVEDSAPVVVIDPRARALEELARIRALSLIERGELRQFYILLSETLRGFAAALESDWSTDLTTSELAPRLQRDPEAAPLLTALRAADTVKFAKRQATRDEAARDLDAAEAWVGSFRRITATAQAA